jgi:putative membrane protein
MKATALRQCALAAASVFALNFGAYAQTASPASGAAAKSASLDSADRKFIEKAATGGMAEVEMGKLAQQHAASDQVKQFADRMVQDHSKANDELKAIATSKGVQLPGAPDKAAKRNLDKLGKLSGANFDREYMQHMVGDHKSTVAMFQAEAKSGKDADVKGFAGKTLPTLQEHLKMAQTVNDAARTGKNAAAKANAAASK